MIAATIRKDSITMTHTQNAAVSQFPDATSDAMATDTVLVLPRILPASMEVAPYSPIALAKASTVPEASPGAAFLQPFDCRSNLPIQDGI